MCIITSISKFVKASTISFFICDVIFSIFGILFLIFYNDGSSLYYRHVVIITSFLILTSILWFLDIKKENYNIEIQHNQVRLSDIIGFMTCCAFILSHIILFSYYVNNKTDEVNFIIAVVYNIFIVIYTIIKIIILSLILFPINTSQTLHTSYNFMPDSNDKVSESIIYSSL